MSISITSQVINDFIVYLGSDAEQWDNDTLESVLTTEAAVQGDRLRDSAFTKAPVKEALFRRSARALAMRALPLGISFDNEAGSTRIGSRDPEVARLEAPYRKWPVG